ncbi:T9SS type A sorting domain-containing protein [Spirosoma sp. RP8]|uniref:T9SS type A sorting domain-containing protein n=1 Tax=Spirosoma liriopis TaxID=2937440 RepID=A0ABT0HQA8_9BACT|nr:T9SS type A sorting domain-containing protein [Spirosoma liriopis]MCK8494351.1 T9SS type A sorting domain-containing protein [Spirosoma liriopis]
MKQIILIGFLTAFLTGTTPLRAQVAPRDSDARKGSRLELGRTAGSRKQTAPTLSKQRFSLAPPTATTAVNLDRSATIRKNAPINEYYRSLLVGRPATKSTARSSASDATPSPTEAKSSPDIAIRDDEQLFSNDQITVSNIYPNPASESAEIDYQIKGHVGEAKLILLNVLGSPIEEYDMSQHERKVRVATRSLASGYYFYQLSFEGKKVATKKLLVRHQ